MAVNGSFSLKKSRFFGINTLSRGASAGTSRKKFSIPFKEALERGRGSGFLRSRDEILNSFSKRLAGITNSFLCPVPSKKGFSEVWYDYYASQTGRVKAMRRIFRTLLPQIQGKSVLDLTAATGLTSKALIEVLREKGARISKLIVNDPSTRALKLAKNKIKRCSRRTVGTVRFVNDALVTQRLDSYKSDVVVLSGSLHFSTNEERIALISRALKLTNLGGMLLFIDVESWNISDSHMPKKVVATLAQERSYLNFDDLTWKVPEVWEMDPSCAIGSLQLKKIPSTPLKNSGSTLKSVLFKLPS